MTIRAQYIEHLERKGCRIVGTVSHYIVMDRPDRKDIYWYLGRNGGVNIGSRLESLISLERDNVYAPLRHTCFEDVL